MRTAVSRIPYQGSFAQKLNGIANCPMIGRLTLRRVDPEGINLDICRTSQIMIVHGESRVVLPSALEYKRTQNTQSDQPIALKRLSS